MRPLLLLTLFGCDPGTTVIENYYDSCCCEDDTSPGDSGDTGDTGAGCEDLAAPELGEVDTVDDCIADPSPIEFAPEVEWTWAPDDADHQFNQVMVTPVVGNLTDDDGDGVIDSDDTPDVVFTAYAGTAYQDSPGALVVVDGSSGSELAYHTSLTDAEGNTYVPQSRGGVALGDVDADGIPEACFPTDTAPLICIHADGEVVLVGETPAASAGIDRDEWANGYPAIGDMDGDGQAEIAIGRVIWDSTGAIVGVGAGSHGGYVHASLGWFAGISVMSDIDGDDELELVAGNVAYERDGSELWTNSAAENGFSAVGDLDGDTYPDVVTTGVDVAYVLDHTGDLIETFALVGCGSGNTCGPPTIADFDADTEPEIGIAGVTGYTVYDNASGSWQPRWSEDIYDYSGSTGAVVFDFEADGEAEVVFADEEQLYIWGGSDGADRLGVSGWDPTDHGSGTGAESPSIADVDNDGSTEILLASNELFAAGWHGVRAIGSGSGPAWAPSRPVWNQHSYHISNIEDDLSVPVIESPNWTTHNNFRTQDQGERPGSWQPDLAISTVSYCVDCDAGESTFYVVVENQGLDASGPVDVTVDSNGVVLHSESVDLGPQENQLLGPFTITNSDWTDTLTVTVDGDELVDECDEANNDEVVGRLPCE